MQQRVVTVGVDLAKSIFAVHGVDERGEVVFRKNLGRPKVEAFFAELPPCLVGMEACATAHHWSRVLTELGHEVKLMPPAYVKPYVKSQKNDASDAEAICEAVTRPNMRFVTPKSVEQQSVLTLHRTRTMIMTHRTRLVNTVRAHLAEFGIIAPVGRLGFEQLAAIVADHEDDRIPAPVRDCLVMLIIQFDQVNQQILDLDRQINRWHRESELSKRLATIPGVGPVSATALVATIGDGKAFSSGRSLSAFLGLVPKQRSSGGKERLGGISKRGDRPTSATTTEENSCQQRRPHMDSNGHKQTFSGPPSPSIPQHFLRYVEVVICSDGLEIKPPHRNLRIVYRKSRQMALDDHRTIKGFPFLL